MAVTHHQPMAPGQYGEIYKLFGASHERPIVPLAQMSRRCLGGSRGAWWARRDSRGTRTRGRRSPRCSRRTTRGTCPTSPSNPASAGTVAEPFAHIPALANELGHSVRLFSRGGIRILAWNSRQRLTRDCYHTLLCSLCNAGMRPMILIMQDMCQCPSVGLLGVSDQQGSCAAGRASPDTCWRPARTSAASPARRR